MNTKRMRATARLAALGGLGLGLALLAGCISIGGGGKPPALLATLSPEAVAAPGATSSATPGQALLVMEPQTPRELQALRVPVRIDASRLAYLSGAAWVDRPSRLFRALLAETLRAGGHHLVAEDDMVLPPGGTRLSGRLDLLGYDAGSHTAVVRFDALRENADGSIVTRRFEASVKGVAPQAGAVVPALNAAANAVARQVAEWVG